MSETVLTDTFFSQFDLHPRLQQGLHTAGFSRCTPIQALTLPVALTGRDVAGQAQTGTGKTCAFLVAMMNRLLTTQALPQRKDSDPRALVIAPTRELAIQIEKDARHIGRDTGLKTALIYGGVDYDKQRQQLLDGCDIIIATPGRLLDYYKQQVFGLSSVEVMVLDEADRMFDLGFIKDIRYIFRRLPERKQRQVLLFSATLSHRVLELAYEHMDGAEKLLVESEQVTADRVRQLVYFPAKEEKLPLLLNLLKETQPSRSIVFVNTKAAAERITEKVCQHGYRVGALSGDVPQLKRQKLLQRFQDGQLDMLVCTDVAARGLHIPAVSHVFNYDLPQDAEDYVHRIGRTGRLGAEGDAISFACDLYAMSLPDIESYIGQRIPAGTIDSAWLIMPQPVAAPMRAEADTESESATSEAGTQAKSRRRGGRRRSGANGERTAAPIAGTLATNDATVENVVGEAPAHSAERRRRGGRNRRRDSVPAELVGTIHSDRRAAVRASEPTRAGDSRPSREIEITTTTAAAPISWLRRLGRLLFGH